MVSHFLLQIAWTFDRLIISVMLIVFILVAFIGYKLIYRAYRKALEENKKLNRNISQLKKLLNAKQNINESVQSKLRRKENVRYLQDHNFPLPHFFRMSYEEFLERIENIGIPSYSKFGPNSLPYFDVQKNQNGNALGISNLSENNTLLWSMYIQSRFSRDMYWRTIPGYKFTTYGFLKLNTSGQYQDDNEYCFGVIIHADLGEWEYNRFRYDPSRLDPLVIDLIKIENYNFPVFIHFISEKLHCSSPHPANGQSTCIAETQLEDVGYKVGILTARHVTGHNRGEEIDLRCGRRGVVVDVSPGSIDAAVVACDDCDTTTNKMISPIENVAPWTNVSFQTEHKGVVKARVTSCENPLGIFDSPLFPLMIIMDEHGDHGDSGSLVLDTESGRPIGLYVGSYVDRAGRRGGIAQHLYQVTQIMKLNLYQL